MEQATKNTCKSVTAIVRKLHGWELLHLREHAAELERRVEELEAENERLRRDCDYAKACAESWRDDVMRMMDDGMELGLTLDGHVVKLESSFAAFADAEGTWVNLTGDLAEFVPAGERCSTAVHADMISRAYDEPPPADHIAAMPDGVALSEIGKRSTSAATASGHEIPDANVSRNQAMPGPEGAGSAVANWGDARVASAGRPSGVLEDQKTQRERRIANGYRTDSRCTWLAIGRCGECGRIHDGKTNPKDAAGVTVAAPSVPPSDPGAGQ